MKPLVKKASSLAAALLAASAASGCAKDLHAPARVPTQGAVDQLPGSPFSGSRSISADETVSEEQIFAGRQNLEQKANAMEMKSIEHRIRRHALLCSADYERRTWMWNLPTDEVVDLKAACEAEAAELGLKEAAATLRDHGDNMHDLERQKTREEREAIIWNDNREIRMDSHAMRMKEREAAIEERALRAQQMLEMQKANLARIEDERQLRREYMQAYQEMRIEAMRRQFERAAQPAASCPMPAAPAAPAAKKPAARPPAPAARDAKPINPCVEPKKP